MMLCGLDNIYAWESLRMLAWHVAIGGSSCFFLQLLRTAFFSRCSTVGKVPVPHLYREVRKGIFSRLREASRRLCSRRYAALRHLSTARTPTFICAQLAPLNLIIPGEQVITILSLSLIVVFRSLYAFLCDAFMRAFPTARHEEEDTFILGRGVRFLKANHPHLSFLFFCFVFLLTTEIIALSYLLTPHSLIFNNLKTSSASSTESLCALCHTPHSTSLCIVLPKPNTQVVVLTEKSPSLSISNNPFS